jgi:hypothetical protein
VLERIIGAIHAAIPIARISSRIEIIASMKRSSSAFDSLSVGSTIRVPATGKLIVGA